MTMPKNTPERICIICGNNYVPKYNKQRFCGHKCAFTKTNQEKMIFFANKPEARKKQADSLRGRGLKLSYTKKFGVHQHRAIAEKKIGRKLGKNEVVHHIDGNKHNNSEENLEVMNRSDHMKIHSPSKFKTKQTHCKNGHILSGDNIVINSSGSRLCLICRRIYQNKWHKNKRKLLKEGKL